MRDDIEYGDIAAMRIEQHQLAATGLEDAFGELRPGPDDRRRRQAEGARKIGVFDRAAAALYGQEQDRQLRWQARHHLRDISLHDESVDADRQMRPVLLDRCDRKNRDDLAHVGFVEVGPAHLRPEPRGQQHFKNPSGERLQPLGRPRRPPACIFSSGKQKSKRVSQARPRQRPSSGEERVIRAAPGADGGVLNRRAKPASFLRKRIVRQAFSLVLGFALVVAISPFANAQDRPPEQKLDKVTFATNWLAEAEHGGFYQALADGTYARYGLDVTILQGGPQTNNRLLLAAGKIEFNLAANLIQSFDAVSQNIPIVAVASLFQKDPFILMSHPGSGFDHIVDLPKATAFIGKDAFVSVYQWLKTAYGFREDKVQPYTFNAAPFIRDKNSIQQGYATSEPFAVEREGGFKPNVFLLADYGYLI